MVKLDDLMPVAVKCSCKGSPLKIAAKPLIGIRGNDCRRKDLPCQINIRRQDKAFAVIRSIGSQGQQIWFCGNLVWVVRIACAAAI